MPCRDIQPVKTFLLSLVLLAFVLTPVSSTSGEKKAQGDIQIPILLYHRFGPVVADSMTVTTPVFESHLKYLRDNGYTVIPLRRLVDYYLGKGPAPLPRSVVIVADDGHRSVYSDMLPMIQKYRIPVTLFLYPSAISNASYAMTWDELREVKKTGLVEFGAHSYWHPNFEKEKKKLTPVEYDKFVRMQLGKGKEKIEKELDIRIDMLAWPFGIYDDELIRKATEAGYIAAFTIERRHTRSSDAIMTLPRYLMTDRDRGKAFEGILAGAPVAKKVTY